MRFRCNVDAHTSGILLVGYKTDLRPPNESLSNRRLYTLTTKDTDPS